MKSRKRGIVTGEGTAAARRFDATMDQLLRVSKAELEKREAAYQEARKDKPRRGPKPASK